MNLDEVTLELNRADPALCYEAFQTMEAAEAVAKGRGVIARYPTNYELFLDFDTKEYPPKFRRLLGVVDEVWGIVQYAETGGVSGRGRHVRIQLRETINDNVRIPLQAMLGSDPMRELLHWTSWEKAHPYVQVLFEKEGYEETPVDWMKIFSDCGKEIEMSVKIDVERVVRETVPLEFSVTSSGEDVVLWAKWNGKQWAVVQVDLNGVYPFGGFPKDFPIQIDPETQRAAIVTK